MPHYVLHLLIYTILMSLLVCPLCLPQLETMMNQVNTLQGRINMVEKEKVSTCNYNHPFN